MKTLTQFFLLIVLMLGFTFSQAQTQVQPIKTFDQPGYTIIALAFSPDNKIVATAGNDNNIILWDINSGTKLNTLKGHTNWVISLAFSPTGNAIASSSRDHTAKIWDVRSGSEIVTLKGHTESVSGIIYSPDGKTIATSSKDATVKIWDAVSGLALRSLGGHVKEVSCVAFSPDGMSLASAGADVTLKIWDVQSGSLVRTQAAAHKSYVTSVCYSPDGKYIATGSQDKTINLWEAKTGVLEKTIKGHSNWIQSLHFSPDAKYLASGSHDFNATVWDVASGMEVYNVKKQSNIIFDVEFSNDGKMLATCDQSKIKLWDISKLNITPKETQAKGNIVASNENTNDLDFDPAAKGKNYLLIIGVSKYSYWPQLGNAVKDAKDVKRILTTKYRFNTTEVVEVFDEQATIEGIYSAFNKLKGKIKANDNLVIYFSGHGFYNAGLDEGYWIPVDAHKGKEAEYLPNSTLLKYIKSMETKHTFLVADACFSGSLFSDGHRGYVENVEAMRSRWGLTSGRLEYVSDGNVGKNSPFANYFIKYLETNTKKRFTVSELIQYVKISVANNSDQTPVGNPLRNVGDEGGEFVFYLK